MNDKYGLPGTISVAISFSRGSHEDYREAIIEIINSFEKRTSYDVSVYIDRDNHAGDEFKVVIDERFREADIIICLVTNSFLKNSYVLRFEKPIIEDFASPYRRDKRVIPIIVSKTDNYVNSWMGETGRSTLPTIEAAKKPYSYYNNKKDAEIKIKNGLHRVFKNFHNNVIYKQKMHPKPRVGKLLLVIIAIFIFLFAWKFIENSKEEPEPSLSIQPVLPPDNSPRFPEPDYPIDQPEKEDPDLPQSPVDYDIPPPHIAICNSKSTMQTTFPRDLWTYPYFGKELYGRYESCQGMNENGYKPCKKNRKWYIVNEKRNQHLILKLDTETHKDIYAIRPLLNNVAEVYFHNGESMYLAFCVSLEDGVEIE